MFQLINFIGYVCERQVNETTLVGEKGGGKRQQTQAAPSRGVYVVLQGSMYVGLVNWKGSCVCDRYCTAVCPTNDVKSVIFFNENRGLRSLRQSAKFFVVTHL